MIHLYNYFLFQVSRELWVCLCIFSLSLSLSFIFLPSFLFIILLVRCVCVCFILTLLLDIHIFITIVCSFFFLHYGVCTYTLCTWICLPGEQISWNWRSTITCSTVRAIDANVEYEKLVWNCRWIHFRQSRKKRNTTRVFLWHYVNFGWATSRAKRDKNPTRIESEAEKRGKREGGGHTQVSA